MTTLDAASRPVLAARTYLHLDRLTGETVLRFPENILALNPQAAAIVAQCDGTTRVDAITATLAEEYAAEPAEIHAAVLTTLETLCRRRLVLPGGPARPPYKSPPVARTPRRARAPYRPYVLLAELTYRCPLHCPYCSNPLCSTGGELSSDEWCRVFQEAADEGVLHVALSGGEPLLRPDLDKLVLAAAQAALYPNLITSGIGLDERRVHHLRDAGLESVQISLQSDDAVLADEIAGARAHAGKLRVARLVVESGLALSLNVVLHHGNIERLESIIALAESLGATRLELANVQFYGWGFLNRNALLPTRAQVEAAERIAVSAKRRLAERMDIFYVLPDLYEDRPKPCLQGWGRQYLTVNPAGEVLPCPTAGSIPDLKFDNVRERSLAWIWRNSAAFERFRGTHWLPEPCRECPRREIDFGGCRCQAALLTGEAGLTDPVCALSPHRALVDNILAQVESGDRPALIKRDNPKSIISRQ